MRVMKTVPGPDLEALPFGLKVRYCRLSIKMSAERFAILYAQAIGRKKPYTARRIEQLEEHDGFPTDKTRRWAIARIVQMGLFFNLSSLSINSPFLETTQQFPAHRFSKLKLDISDHQAALKQGWTLGFPGTLEEAEEEILDRIYDIHDKAPYLSNQQKDQAWRTLCGYHILLATQVHAARSDTEAMTKSTNMAVILARENNYQDLRATALLQRAVFARTQGNYQAALLDFQAAQRLKGLPQQLRGKILGEMARAKAKTAQTQEKVDKALELLDEAESTIDQSTLEDFGFLVAFNEDKYNLERGEVLMGSPQKQLRSPETALSYLPPIYRVDETLKQEHFQTIGHRQAHNHLLQAEIYLDQEQYPIAVALAEEVLAFTESLQSTVNLPTLAKICDTLEKSPIGNSIEVTMLGIGIMRNLHPQSLN